MGNEVDLLKNYPKPSRNLEQRAEQKTEENREIARQFGKASSTAIGKPDMVVSLIIRDFGNPLYLPCNHILTSQKASCLGCIFLYLFYM